MITFIHHLNSSTDCFCHGNRVSYCTDGLSRVMSMIYPSSWKRTECTIFEYGKLRDIVVSSEAEEWIICNSCKFLSTFYGPDFRINSYPRPRSHYVEKTSDRDISCLSLSYRFLNTPLSECFPSKLKRKDGVFKVLRFEERFRKAPFSWRINMDGKPNRGNKAAFENFSCVVWTLP